jgi:hypothetical protein
MPTAEGRPATARMPEIVELPATVLVSAGEPTAHYTVGANFQEIREKVIRMATFVKKDTKKE